MKRSLLLLVLLLAVPVVAQQATNLTAAHRHGQTFLTWNNLAQTGVVYRVYRSANRITQSSDLASATLLGSVGDSSSYNVRFSTIQLQPYFFRIDSAALPLSIRQGLFVQTPVGAGDFYYAVTAAINGQENTAITAGQNALNAPVVEAIARPRPVWQTTVTQQNRVQIIYAHWVSAVGQADYPAMATTNSFAFNFALQRKGTAPLHPLIVRLHGREANFMDAIGTTNPDEWILALDDYLPNDLLSTFWYGYHEKFDFFTGAGVPTSGAVQDYTGHVRLQRQERRGRGLGGKDRVLSGHGRDPPRRIFLLGQPDACRRHSGVAAAIQPRLFGAVDGAAI